MKRNIIYDYLDTESAVIRLLKDYRKYEHILNTVNRELVEIDEKMCSVGALRIDGMPRARNTGGREGYLIGLIAQKDMCIEKEERANEYMRMIKPALARLDDEEYEILNSLYIGDPVPVKNLAAGMGYSLSNLYLKRDEAISALSLILYGR